MILGFLRPPVPLSACIFFAEKAKKDTTSIGAKLEVVVILTSLNTDIKTYPVYYAQLSSITQFTFVKVLKFDKVY